MTALDTNVLVRIITNDDRAQAARAATFLREQERVFIPKTVLLELEWVLRSAYRIGPIAIVSALRDLLTVFNVEIEDEAAVTQAIESVRERDGLCRWLARRFRRSRLEVRYI